MIRTKNITVPITLTIGVDLNWSTVKPGQLPRGLSYTPESIKEAQEKQWHELWGEWEKDLHAAIVGWAQRHACAPTEIFVDIVKKGADECSADETSSKQ